MYLSYDLMVRKDDEYNYHLMAEFVLPCDDEERQGYVTQVCDPGNIIILFD